MTWTTRRLGWPWLGARCDERSAGGLECAAYRAAAGGTGGAVAAVRAAGARGGGAHSGGGVEYVPLHRTVRRRLLREFALQWVVVLPLGHHHVQPDHRVLRLGWMLDV